MKFRIVDLSIETDTLMSVNQMDWFYFDGEIKYVPNIDDWLPLAPS